MRQKSLVCGGHRRCLRQESAIAATSDEYQTGLILIAARCEERVTDRSSAVIIGGRNDLRVTDRSFAVKIGGRSDLRSSPGLSLNQSAAAFKSRRHVAMATSQVPAIKIGRLRRTVAHLRETLRRVLRS